MKNFIYLFPLLLVITIGNCFAQTTDPKYYYDYEQNYEGYAVAIL